MAGEAAETIPGTEAGSKSPALAGQATDLTALRDVVVDAAAVSAGLWLSYIFVLLYLLIAVGGITHRNLFLEDPVKMPFLNVDLPLIGFFVLGPGLFLIVHAYVLLHFVLLAGKAGVFHSELRAQISSDKVRAQLRGQLPSNIFVQVLARTREVRTGIIGRMLRLISQISLAVAPLALLLLFQVQFLPYHPTPIIALWLRVTVVIDLALLWTLWPSVARGKVTRIAWRDFKGPGIVAVAVVRLVRTSSSRPFKAPAVRTNWRVLRRVARRGTVAAAFVTSLVPMVFVFVISTYPGERLDNCFGAVPFIASLHRLAFPGTWDVTGRPASWFSDHLILSDQSFVGGDKPDKANTGHSFRGRDLSHSVLARSDLRNADFAAALLDEADFHDARLQGAHLGCVPSYGGLLNRGCAQLRGASFDAAQLQGADFLGAELQGASFFLADVRGADFSKANLLVANFDQAQAEGASFAKADLRGADFHQTSMQGANVDDAKTRGALLASTEVWRAHGDFEKDGLPYFVHCEPNKIPWPDSTSADFGSWLDLALEDVPKGKLRDAAKARLSALAPRPEKASDQASADGWKAKCSTTELDTELAAKRADFLTCLVCSDPAARYLAESVSDGYRTGAYEYLSGLFEPLADGDKEKNYVTVFVNRLRTGRSDPATCPQAAVFRNADWSMLDDLETSATRSKDARDAK